MELQLKFVGIDNFNQPIFKSKNKFYYGTNDILFSNNAKAEEVIEKIKNKKIDLKYFGTFFNCEPMGLTIKKEIKIILVA